MLFDKRRSASCGINGVATQASDYYLSKNVHGHITGVPQFKHLDPILDNCSRELLQVWM